MSIYILDVDNSSPSRVSYDGFIMPPYYANVKTIIILKYS